MPHRPYRPELMGRATLSPAEPVEAGAYASLTLVYEAGRFGIDDQGSIKIAWRDTVDMGTPQFDDPQAPGYTTIEASNGARLVTRVESKRNIRPFGKSIYVQVTGGFLRAGDRITVRLGDRSQGSPGIRMPTFVIHRFELRVLTDVFATYDYMELPEQPAIAIVPGPPVAWKAVLPTLRRPGDRVRLSLKAEDRWGNPSDRIDREISLRVHGPLQGVPERLRFEPGRRALVIDDLLAREEGDVRVEVLDEAGATLATSNPMRIAADAPYRHFWADLHGQSEETVGNNTALDYFAFARDLAFLDACSHQGNDFQITAEVWEEINRLTRAFDAPGRFVALPGYEWSGNTGMGGDRNVWFRHEDRPIRRSCHALIPDLSDEASDCHTAAELFEALQGEDVVCAAHVGGRYADICAHHDGRIEHSVEVHSAWGTFEWMLGDAFSKGYRIGILANSDGHKGRPGASYPGASLFGAYGGLTCLLAERLDRDGVMEALRRRRHAATTGARILIDAAARFEREATLFLRDPALVPAETERVRVARMGDIVTTEEDHVTFTVEVLASAPIERLELRDATEVLETVRPYRPEDLGRRIRVLWEGSEYRGRGRNVDWQGEARLEGNRILRLVQINGWNPEKPIVQEGATRVRFQAITSGNFGGFDLWLEEPLAGGLVVDTAHVRLEIPIANIGYEDLCFPAGGLGKGLRLFRLPDENPHRRLRVERRIPLRPDGDTRLHARLTQEDGHLAWSSPIYLLRG
jgi:hypothetical protein